MVCVQTGIYLVRKKRRLICRKMDGAGEHCAKTDRLSKANTFLSDTEYRLDDIKVWGALFGRRRGSTRECNVG